MDDNEWVYQSRNMELVRSTTYWDNDEEEGDEEHKVRADFFEAQEEARCVGHAINNARGAALVSRSDLEAAVVDLIEQARRIAANEQVAFLSRCLDNNYPINAGTLAVRHQDPALQLEHIQAHEEAEIGMWHDWTPHGLVFTRNEHHAVAVRFQTESTTTEQGGVEVTQHRITGGHLIESFPRYPVLALTPDQIRAIAWYGRTTQGHSTHLLRSRRHNPI